MYLLRGHGGSCLHLILTCVFGDVIRQDGLSWERTQKNTVRFPFGLKSRYIYANRNDVHVAWGAGK